VIVSFLLAIVSALGVHPVTPFDVSGGPVGIVKPADVSGGPVGFVQTRRTIRPSDVSGGPVGAPHR
jgi:hypothetical protein